MYPNRLTFLFLFLALLVCNISNAQKLWTLRECIDTALERNIQIQQSAIQLQVADNAKDAGMAAFFPTLNASAGYNWNFGLNIDPVTNVPSRDSRQTSNLGLQANWTLFDGLRNYNTLAQNRLDYASRIYQLEDVKNNTSLTVASQYLQILLNREIERIAQMQLELTEAQIKRMTDLVNVGTQPYGSLLDLQAQKARDIQSYTLAKNNLKVSRLQLAQSILIEDFKNFDVSGLDIPAPGAEILALDANQIYQAALQNQPSIKSSEFSLESAQKSTATAKGSAWPTISLFGSVQTNYSNQVRDLSLTPRDPELIGITGNGDQVFDFGGFNLNAGEIKDFSRQYNDNFNEFIGISINVPIWSGLQIRNAIRNAKLNEENANLQLTAARNTLQQTIERAYADAEAAYESYLAAEKSVAAAEESYKYAQVRYENGAINQFDYENALNALSRSKAQKEQSRYDYIFRVKTLEFYLNGNL